MLISETLEKRLSLIGMDLLRWSLVLFFVGFGLYKFTPQEAAGIEPLMTHSAFLFWVNPLFGRQGGSNFIGVIEITFGVLIALRHVRPLLSAYGALATAGALVVTLSFLVTTPGLDPFSIDAGFLSKDLTLLGAAVFVSAEAFAAARRRSPSL